MEVLLFAVIERSLCQCDCMSFLNNLFSSIKLFFADISLIETVFYFCDLSWAYFPCSSSSRLGNLFLALALADLFIEAAIVMFQVSAAFVSGLFLLFLHLCIIYVLSNFNILDQVQ